MKFRCGHCGHVFILSNEDLRRCPKCFWTTALDPLLEDDRADKEVSRVKTAATQGASSPHFFFSSLAIRIFVVCCVLAFLIGGIILFFKAPVSNALSSIKKSPLFLPQTSAPAPLRIQPPQPKTVLSVVAKKPDLTEDEKTQLKMPFQLTIPRSLGEREIDILERRAPSVAGLTQAPTLNFWSLDDFKAFLKSAQEQRKIPLGWAYVRGVTKAFENGYLKAAQFYEQGDYLQARNALLSGLALPVYQNSVEKNRAIALVMLRPYINDVLGKLAAFGGYFAYQQSGDSLRRIDQSYQDLAGAIDSRDWNKASMLAEDLLSRINQYAQAPESSLPPEYPPVFSQIDQEIQTAIIRQARTPAPQGTSTDFSALREDLEAKAKVIRENNEEALMAVQKNHEQAVYLIEREDWRAAYQLLKDISYPEELAGDAAKKIAILEKHFIE